MSLEESRKRCWFVDSTGLVESSRTNLTLEKLSYAHPFKPISDLETAVKELKPTILIGVSGQPGYFTKTIIEEMTKLNPIPVIFALSNPTSKAECTAEQAYTWVSFFLFPFLSFFHCPFNSFSVFFQLLE